jgi:hypothetical protein
MFLRRAFNGVWIAGLFFAALSTALATALPPLTGDLAGKLRWAALPELEAVEWNVHLQQSDAHHRRGEITLTAAQAAIRVEVIIDDATENGEWRILEAELDAAHWFAVLAPKFSIRDTSLAAEGRIRLEGSGVLRGGVPSGVLRLTWTNGVLKSPVKGWSLEGISFKGEFAMDAAQAIGKSTSPAELRIQTITTPRFGARAFHAEAVLNENGTASLNGASVEIAGGSMQIEPCTATLSPFSITGNVRITHIGLQDVVGLIQAGLADARGRVSGVAQLSWTKENGWDIGAGHLAIDPDEATIVRLAPTHGLLTNHMPERIKWLPDWLGPVSNWLALRHSAYGDMQSIELGKTNLRVRSLAVQLTPEGDGQNRTASVEIVASPETTGMSVDEVSFEINVFGPLAAIFKSGNKGTISLSAH